MTDDEKLAAYRALGDALARVHDAIAIAEKGRLLNPSKEEERKLRRLVGKLQLERADIKAARKAIRDGGDDDYPPPTAGQVAEIAALTGEVEGFTSDNQSVSGAIEIGTRVLGMAASLADVGV